MTPPDVLARALAAALLDGEWEPRAMLSRLRRAMGVERPWIHTLMRAARSRYAHAPSSEIGAFAHWLSSHEAFGDALAERRQVVHYATPAPEMAESPWRVPALATTRELGKLRAILHNCRRHGAATQNRDGHPDFRAHLRGRVAWISSLDPRKGAQLQSAFQQIQWDGHGGSSSA